VIECPAIEILPPVSYDAMDRAVRRIADRHYDWIIFTSVNGVRFFWRRFKMLKGDVKKLAGVKIAAIGPATAKRLLSRGLKPHLVPDHYRAEGILEALAPKEVRGRRVLLPRAREARDILPKTLRAMGADEVDVVEAYRIGAGSRDGAALRARLAAGAIDMVTFTSSGTVTHFLDLFPAAERERLLARTAVACIGPVTSETAAEHKVRVDVIAPRFTVEALTEAIVDFFSRPAARSRAGGDAPYP
jgi:uroporphyrinogen III methyltransferase/synthase